MALGLYISVPFCRTKCSYCNFASGVFSRAAFERYTEHVCADVTNAPRIAGQMAGDFERVVDSIYLGGGTPTLLDVTQLERLFVTIQQNFDLEKNTELTVECAPGTLTPQLLEAFHRWNVTRVTLGVQSFVDQEAAAVGRLHKRSTVLADIERLRATGISNINIDLIAGLPHQTPESWNVSLEETIAASLPHVSVYMLEVDEDSRLGRELIAGGTKYHAHFVPDDDATADLYLAACERLDDAGIHQYEISNFAREGFESRHNLKYWTRQPYLGFGVDAHSMLSVAGNPGVLMNAVEGGTGEPGRESLPSEALAVDLDAVRFSTPDSLEDFLADKPVKPILVSRQAALEETFFLGLRLTRGLNLQEVALKFGTAAVAPFAATIKEFQDIGLIESQGDTIRLTPRGRLLSSEVFEQLVSVADTVNTI